MKVSCSTCTYSRPIAGDCHTSCEKGLALMLAASSRNVAIPPINLPKFYSASKDFMLWPISVDESWLISCPLFEAKSN